MENEQIAFWRDAYGQEYMAKNDSFDLLTGIEAWKIMLRSASDRKSILEAGCNIGRNLAFIRELDPSCELSVIELNENALEIARRRIPLKHSFCGAITEAQFPHSFDLVFTMGVLIHIQPSDLFENLLRLTKLSSRYLLIGEYFSVEPTMIRYQGQDNKLFKRDFGKFVLENFPLKFVDAGFLWSHQFGSAGFDDITWWLFECRE